MSSLSSFFDRSFFRSGSAPATQPVRAVKSNGAHTTFLVDVLGSPRPFRGELQQVMLSAINFEIGDLCRRLGIRRRTIYEVVMVGNATMRDILFGFDVQSIGEKPYKSVTELETEQGVRDSTVLNVTAKELGYGCRNGQTDIATWSNERLQNTGRFGSYPWPKGTGARRLQPSLSGWQGYGYNTH